jgi:hypothetical protein
VTAWGRQADDIDIEIGTAAAVRTFVMRGLDPRIHVSQMVLACGNPWMAGTSPAMTAFL